MNATKTGTLGSNIDVTLIDLDFFQGNLDYFVDLYNTTNRRLQADGYNGYFDSAPFSPEWWDCVSCFIMFGFTYEAILNIEKNENLGLIPREARREIERLKDREKLCKNASKYLIEFMHGAFFKIKSGEEIPSGYLDPKIARFPAVNSFVYVYWRTHIDAFEKTCSKARNGIMQDDSSTIASKEAMQIVKLVQMIVERSDTQVHDKGDEDKKCGKTKAVIDRLKVKIAELATENAKLQEVRNQGESTQEKLTENHANLRNEYNQMVDDHLKLEERISDLERIIEAQNVSLSSIPKLELIIKLQSSLIIYNQDHSIQPLFKFEDALFQSRFRAILKKYISDIGDSIGSHLSSTTANVTTGSGSFAFHVIGTLFNHISKTLENQHWTGIIETRHHLHIPQNGDSSKGGIYDFLKLTNNLKSMGFLEFFQWLGTQKMVGQSNFGTVFDTIGGKVKERTPALQREIREFMSRYTIELQKQK